MRLEWRRIDLPPKPIWAGINRNDDRRETDSCFVWTWLPDSTDPVLAGRIDEADDPVSFTYEPGNLARQDAVPLCLPELPLDPSRTDPPGLRRVAGVIEDAGGLDDPRARQQCRRGPRSGQGPLRDLFPCHGRPVAHESTAGSLSTWLK